MIEVAITTDYITLGQFLKYVKVCETGGQAKQLILDGKVKVNGAIELKRGKKLRKNDIIEVEGKIYVIK
ncbi:S4 domain-containing protein YaaA [Thermoanaerobacter kivui]|uniref:S4 domain-containing protein YaaA n=1 Tax=Thermoanaerobacter kivui TaxID=2325 RepID=A0A097AN55_THEKI|nr:S4 domain-containing protein YaaA [Thermoanaerobacter kivui]AIS51222.1 S4 domain-containing protein YaaA [Thermoanaerobacter kivui]